MLAVWCDLYGKYAAPGIRAMQILLPGGVRTKLRMAFPFIRSPSLCLYILFQFLVPQSPIHSQNSFLSLELSVPLCSDAAVQRQELCVSLSSSL